MRRSSVVRCFGLAAFLTLWTLGGSSAQAQTTYYWTTASGTMTPGNGTWDTATPNWSTTTTGDATLSTWSGSSADTADFYANSSPTSTIAVNGTQNVGNITFDGSGYTLTGGQLNLGGGTITANANAEIDSVIGGGAGLTKAGTGQLYLTAVNAYTGGTTVNAGTLALGNADGLGIIRGSLTINSGATVNAAQSWGLGFGGGTCVGNVAINNGALTFVFIPGGTSGGISAGTVTMSGGTISGVAFDWYHGTTATPTLNTLASSIPAVISAQMNLRLGSTGALTFNVAQGTVPTGVDLLVSGPLVLQNGGEGGGITKTGAGLLALSGGNTYTGATIVGAGTLQIGNGGSGEALASGGISVSSGAVLAFNETDTLTISPSAGISGDGAVVKFGSGTLVLGSTNNAYTGGTTVNGGILSAATTGALPGYSTAGSVSAASGATVAVQLTGWAQADIDALRTNATLPAGAYLGLDTNGVNAMYSSAIPSIWAGGGGGLAKVGAGALCLTASNTFTGGTAISNGAIVLGNAAALLNSTVAVNAANGLGFSPGIGTFNVGGLSGGSNFALTDTTGGGGVNLSVGGNGANTTYSGVMSGSSGSLTMAGPGALTLLAQNTYAGGTTVNGGTLVLGTSSYVPGIINGSLTINSGATVDASNNWALGVAGAACVNAIALNNGTLNFFGGSDAGGTSAGTVTMTGGTISGSGSLFDWYHGITSTPTLNTIASSIPAVISTQMNLRLTNTGSLTFNVSPGTTASGVDLLINGSIVDGGEAGAAVVKTGSGAMTLAAYNTYSGPTLVNGGTLNLTGQLTASSVTVNGAGAAFNEPSTGVIGGAATTFTLTNGAASLNGINTYLGGTTVNGGTLSLGGAGGSGVIRGALTINSGATVDASSGWSFGIVNGTCVNAVNINNGTLMFLPLGPTSGGVSSSTVTMSGGTIAATSTSVDWYDGITTTPTLNTLASSTDAVISAQINLRLSSTGYLTFNVAQGTTPDGYDLTVSGKIVNGDTGGGIVKTGPGVLYLTADNTYTGGTTVNGGTLVLPGYRGVIIQGNLTINSGATVNANTSWCLGSAAGNNVSNIAINNGTLLFTGDANAGGTSAGTVTMSGGTISGIPFDWYDGMTTTPTLNTLASSTAAVLSSGINLRLSTTGSLTFNVAQGTTPNGVDLLVSGPIIDSGYGPSGAAVIKSGSGLLSLTGANSYSGSTIVSAGVLEAGNAGALPGYATAGRVAVNSGATLLLAAGGSGWSGANIGSLNTSGFQTGSMLAVDTTGGSTTVSGGISGNQGVTVQGNNTLTMTAGNSYTGGTTVNGGTLTLGNAGGTGIIQGSLTINSGATVDAAQSWGLGFGNGTCVNNVNINNGALSFVVIPGGLSGGISAGTVTMSGGTISGVPFDWYHGTTVTPTLNTLASSIPAVISAQMDLRLNGNNLTFNVAQGTTPNGVDLLVSGPIVNGDTGGGVTKTGAGLLCFSGANAYSGNTTVNAGTLAVNGSLPSSGPVFVTGGVLSGDGSVGNVFVSSGAGVLPGYSPGSMTLTAASFSLGIGSVLDYTLAPGAGNSSFLNVTGLVTLPSSGVTVNVTGGSVDAGTYPLIGYGGLSGGLGALSLGFSLPPGETSTFSLSSTSNVIDLVITAPPMVNGQWGVNSGGTWSNSANWNSGNVPGLNPQDTAVFGTILTSGTANVVLDSSRSLSSLGFNTTGANSYVIAASNGSALTMSNTGGAATISSSGGNHVIAAPITLGSNLNVTAVPGSTLTVSGAIGAGGSQAVAVGGGGTLILSGNNTYGGATTVDASTLQVGNGGSGEGLTSSITMSNNATVAFNHNDGLSYSGAISGSGQLIKLGTGNLDLSGSGTYSGPTTISAGTLELDGNGDNLPAATALTIASSGVLDLAGNPLTVGSLSGSAGAVVTNRYASYPSTLTVAPSSGSTTFAGNIIGNNALALSGSGALTLSGTNAYTGGTTVSGGTLDIAAPSALAGSGLVTIAAGGRLVLGSGAGIGALLAASSPAGSGAVALSAAASTPATIGGYESASGNMATLGGAPPLSQGGGGSAVGGSAAAVPEPGTFALLAAGAIVFAASAVRRKRKGC